MMQSFEADATKVLLELTARSVISPWKQNKWTQKTEDQGMDQDNYSNSLLHAHGSWPSNMLFPLTKSLQVGHLSQ